MPKSPRAAFVRGMTRIVDPKGNIKIAKKPLGDSNSDFEALQSDWEEIGNDIKNAIRKYDESLRQ